MPPADQITDFTNTCASISELPSHISTVIKSD